MNGPDETMPNPPEPREQDAFGRRQFIEEIAKGCAAGLPILLVAVGYAHAQSVKEGGAAVPATGGYDPDGHWYAMGVDVSKCIGCARCVVACKTENDVPVEEHFFNTWVERYVIRTNGEVEVTSPNGGIDGYPPIADEASVLRTFFVPKLCNHCEKAPCVQVCPVGATFQTKDGVVLVDESYCVGCRYCIQACPYGARWFHPVKHVAQKCTLCYHRVTKGKVPACVEACPTGARIFGEVEDRSTPLSRFMRWNDIQVLKPHMNTEPKVYYANLDGEVR